MLYVRALPWVAHSDKGIAQSFPLSKVVMKLQRESFTQTALETGIKEQTRINLSDQLSVVI